MSEILTNLLQQNRADKVGGERETGNKILSDTVVNEEIAKEEQEPGPLLHCNNLAESSTGESSDDGTICKI